MILALLLSWDAVTMNCRGGPLPAPEQVTYVVPYLERAMVDAPECSADEMGSPQPCAVYVGAGEWATLETSLMVDSMPDPPVGSVFDVGMPVAVNLAGRSDECGQ